MRTVSKGPNLEVEKQVVCQNCGATIAYVPKDVKTKHESFLYDTWDVQVIACPECGVDIRI